MKSNTPLTITSLWRENYELYKPEIIRLYRQVFSESNWKEWWKCSCGFQSSYSEIPTGKCPECESQMEDYYSEDEIEGFVTDLFEKEYFQALLGLNLSGQVVAFTWWWLDSLENLNTKKLWLSREDFKLLCQTLSKLWCNINTPFYYQSETWVDPSEQGQWFGNIITQRNQSLLEWNKDRITQIIQRTSKQSRMFSMRQKLGYELVYEYADEAMRVLYAKNM